MVIYPGGPDPPVALPKAPLYDDEGKEIKKITIMRKKLFKIINQFVLFIFNLYGVLMLRI